MSTYGKKERNLMRSFSVFRDVGVKDELQGKVAAVKTTKGKKSSKFTIPRRTPRRNDSIDDLANALLEDTPDHLSCDSSTKPTSSTYSLASTKVARLLPNLPILQRSEARSMKRPASALMHGTISGSLTNTTKKHRHTNSGIMTSIEIESADAMQVDGQAIDARATATNASRSNPINLNNKVVALIEEATSGERKSTSTTRSVSGHTGTSKALKPGLQRSKEILMKAKRAVSGHGNSAEKAARSRDILGTTGSALSPDKFTIHDVDSEPATQRLNRRIAEGANLSSPKVRNLTGDGNVPRKPMRAYASFSSFNSRSPPSDDPFSDKRAEDSTGKLSMPDFTQFNCDFSGSPRQSKGKAQMTFTSSATDQNRRQRLRSRFTNKKSGLRQHPETMRFASDVDTGTTPRFRLGPTTAADGKKRLSITNASSPSILDYRIRVSSDSDVLNKAHPTGISGQQSLKRKTAKADLRTGSDSTAKKARVVHAGSNAAAGMALDAAAIGLSTQMAELSTGKPRALAVKDGNRCIIGTRGSSIGGKGLKIFDIPKGKGPAKDEIKGPLKPKRSSSLSAGRTVSISCKPRTLTLHAMVEEDLSMDELA